MNDEEDINLGSGLASLTQLIATGPDSDFIHKEAKAHLFQGSYLKHTPFIVHNETVLKNVEIQFDEMYNYTIPFKGDFIKDIFFKFQLPSISNDFITWKNNLSQRLIKDLCITINNVDIFYLDNIYAGIINKLDSNRSNEEIDFKVNITEINFIYFCYIQIPIWNKTNTRQFLPINSLNNTNINLNFKIANRKSLVQLSPGFYRLRVNDKYVEVNPDNFDIVLGNGLNFDRYKHIYILISQSGNETNPHLFELKIYHFQLSAYESSNNYELRAAKFKKISNLKLFKLSYDDNFEGETYEIVSNETLDKFSISKYENNEIEKNTISISSSNILEWTIFNSKLCHFEFERTQNPLIRSKDNKIINSYIPTISTNQTREIHNPISYNSTIQSTVSNFLGDEIGNLQSIRYNYWIDFMDEFFIPQGLAIHNQYLYVSAYSKAFDESGSSIDYYTDPRNTIPKPRIYRFDMNYENLDTENIDTIGVNNNAVTYVVLDDHVYYSHVGGLIVIDDNVFVGYRDSSDAGIGVYNITNEDFENSSNVTKSSLYLNTDLGEGFSNNGPAFLGLGYDSINNNKLLWYGTFTEDGDPKGNIYNVPILNDNELNLVNRSNLKKLPVHKVQGCVQPYTYGGIDNKEFPILYLSTSYGNNSSVVYEWNYQEDTFTNLSHSFPEGLKGIVYSSNNYQLSNGFQQTNFYTVSEGGSSYYRSKWSGTQKSCICKFNLDNAYTHWADPDLEYGDMNLRSLTDVNLVHEFNFKVDKIYGKILPYIKQGKLSVYCVNDDNTVSPLNIISGKNTYSDEYGYWEIHLEYFKEYLKYNTLNKKNDLKNGGKTFLIEVTGGTHAASGYTNNLTFKRLIYLENCWTSKEFFITPISTLFSKTTNVSNNNFIDTYHFVSEIKRNVYILCIFNLLLDFEHKQDQITQSILISITNNVNNIRNDFLTNIIDTDEYANVDNLLYTNTLKYINTSQYEFINGLDVSRKVKNNFKNILNEIQEVNTRGEYLINTLEQIIYKSFQYQNYPDFTPLIKVKLERKPNITPEKYPNNKVLLYTNTLTYEKILHHPLLISTNINEETFLVGIDHFSIYENTILYESTEVY